MKLRHAVLPLALICALPLAAHAERGFTVQDMVKLDRYGSPTLSPDGKTVVFTKRTVNDELKASTALWSMPVAGGAAKRVTPEGWNVNSPTFAPVALTYLPMARLVMA